MNAIKKKWAKSQKVLNGWLSIANSFSAEVVATQGYDSVTIDLQHGLVDYSSVVQMLQAIELAGVAPMIRVPWLEPGIIMKSLDAGSLGIICPMINNRDEALALVSYCKYPPLGKRSFGPTRANFCMGPDYYSTANSEVICLAMIETMRAMENIEEIVTTPGLDGVYIGPSDLAIGITDGRLAPGFDRKEEEMIDAIEKIRLASFKAGIRSAIHCGSPEYAADAVYNGFDLVTVSNDVRLLASAAKDSVDSFRSSYSSLCSGKILFRPGHVNEKKSEGGGY